MLEDALQLRREHDFLSDARIEQRFLTGAIARQDQRSGSVVANGQPEHPVERRNRVGAEVEVERDDGLDVGMRAIGIVAITLTDLRRVVDLAVAFQPDVLLRIGERLIGAFVKIDDAQTFGADRRGGIAQNGAAVRTAILAACLLSP